MGDRTGVLLVVSALILGASIVAGSLLIRSGLDAVTTEMAGMRSAAGSLNAAAQAGARQLQQPSRSARPDPSKRYSVNTRGAPAKGSADAKVTLVEFSDFQCPFCSRVSPTLKTIEETYGDDVRIVFKHLPLRIHPKAPAAHAAAEAAHRQGKFWEMHDKIFANQQEMSPEKYDDYARELGLDMEKFKADLTSSGVKARVEADKREASRLGVTGTPGFFVNGRFLSGAQPFQSFKVLIDQELDQG